MKKITPLLLPLMAFAVLLSPAFVLAEEAVTTSVTAGVTATPVVTKAEVKATAGQSVALMRGKDRGNQEIDRRGTRAADARRRYDGEPRVQPCASIPPDAWRFRSEPKRSHRPRD